mmetsp:Transcript_18591/g.18681  ORF Transcript_18591/g.18681 Transcript_18591/m.18681 type:complete len:307 (+) Transcript_18591:111-1031(+)
MGNFLLSIIILFVYKSALSIPQPQQCVSQIGHDKNNHNTYGDHGDSPFSAPTAILSKYRPYNNVRDADLLLHEAKRIFLSFKPPLRVIFMINIVGWCAWQIFPEYMAKHALLCTENDKARWWTWITSAFSHQSLSHLVANMSSLSLTGPPVLSLLGLKRFSQLIAFSVFASSLSGRLSQHFSLMLRSHHIRQASKRQASLGFSGVNCALFVFYTIANPDAVLSVGGSPPLSCAAALQYLLLGDTLGLLSACTLFSTNIGHGSHLGGFGAGFLYKWLLCRSGSKSRRSKSKSWSWKEKQKFCRQFFK